MSEIKARAKVRVRHERPYDFDEKSGLWLYKPVDADEIAHNLVTQTGRAKLADFGYGTTPRASGFNYVGVSNNATPPAATDTTLTGEIVGNGLTRAQGTVTLPVSPNNVVSITKIFTFIGATQSVQKTALFDQVTLGTMNHEIQFTQRNLVTNDILTLVFEITIS